MPQQHLSLSLCPLLTSHHLLIHTEAIRRRGGSGDSEGSFRAFAPELIGRPIGLTAFAHARTRAQPDETFCRRRRRSLFIPSALFLCPATPFTAPSLGSFYFFIFFFTIPRFVSFRYLHNTVNVHAEETINTREKRKNFYFFRFCRKLFYPKRLPRFSAASRRFSPLVCFISDRTDRVRFRFPSVRFTRTHVFSSKFGK